MTTARLKDGSGMIQRDVMIMEDLSAYAKVVYCYLVSYAGDKATCYPSILTIAHQLSLSKPTIIKAIKDLELKKLVIIDKVKSKNGYMNNVYQPMFLLDDTSVKEVDLGSKGGLPSSVKEVDPKSIYSNINNKLLSELKNSDIPDSSELEFFKITVAFVELFKENKISVGDNNIDDLLKAKYKSYTTPIRLLIQKDKYKKQDLITVFKYLKSEYSEFWKPNILSTSKLREKFSKLLIQAKKHNTDSSIGYTPQIPN